MDEIINCNDMITRIFHNIEVSDIEEAGKITSVWKKVITGINNVRDEHYGEKMASHTEVIDLKNGQLLVETDHPGWIQAMKFYSKFIIRGMQMNIKSQKIESLCFRLKGSQAQLSETYEEALEKETRRRNEEILKQEKDLENYYKKSGAFGAEKTAGEESFKKEKNEENKLPPEFLATLASLESSILTNSKNK